MVHVFRRDAFRVGCVLCSTALAGCVGSSQSKKLESRLTTIELQNYTTHEQSVLIIVEDAGEQVYGEFTAVPPADGETPEVRDVTDLPVDPGVYDVSFTLARRPDGVEGEFWARAGDTDAECREYLVSIRPDDTGEPLLGISRADGC